MYFSPNPLSLPALLPLKRKEQNEMLCLKEEKQWPSVLKEFRQVPKGR